MCAQYHSIYKTLYIVPYGKFDEKVAPDLQLVARYGEAFFGCALRVTQPVELSEVEEGARVGADGQRQLHVGEVLDHLSQMALPRDAFCRVAVTMVDLYPYPDWNFVFGSARASDAAGVQSFARYDPEDNFFSTARVMTKEERSLTLLRTCKVFAHETCHLLGMRHCVYFKCLMQGSNHQEEGDSKPTYLCPVCLRKLHHRIPQRNLLKRYADLRALCTDFGWEEAAAWLHARHEALATVAPADAEQSADPQPPSRRPQTHAEKQRQCPQLRAAKNPKEVATVASSDVSMSTTVHARQQPNK
eukprot:m.254804 g.254804  ORF g.254804 m.254804 type:complete len:302 (+) comp19150_c0_seq11:590-1495(+)